MGADVLVGICVERSLEMVIGILGILKAGGAYVPLDPDYPRERIAYMIEDARPQVVLTKMSLLEVLPERIRSLCLDTQWAVIDQESNTNLPRHTCPQNLAYVIYTSGSTGKPKGSQIENRNLVNYLSWASRYYYRNGVDGATFALYSSLSFDLTVTSMFFPLIRGKTVHVYAQQVGLRDILLQSFGNDNSIDSIKLTPSHISLLKQIALNKTNIRVAIVGGEALLLDQVRFLWNLNQNMAIYNGPYRSHRRLHH